MKHRVSAADEIPDHLSWSALSTFRTCPLKYYFKYVVGLEETTVSASLVFGAAIHKALEQHYQTLLGGGAPPRLEDLMDAYRAKWLEHSAQEVCFGRHESQPRLTEVALQLLRRFQQSALAFPSGQILGVEADIRGVVVPGLPELRGRVDLIVATPNALIISDWKTSRSRWSEQQFEDATDQLVLYAELVRQWLPRRNVLLEFVILTKSHEAALDHVSLPLSPAHQTHRRHSLARAPSRTLLSNALAAGLRRLLLSGRLPALGQSLIFPSTHRFAPTWHGPGSSAAGTMLFFVSYEKPRARNGAEGLRLADGDNHVV